MVANDVGCKVLGGVYTKTFLLENANFESRDQSRNLKNGDSKTRVRLV